MRVSSSWSCLLATREPVTWDDHPAVTLQRPQGGPETGQQRALWGAGIGLHMGTSQRSPYIQCQEIVDSFVLVIIHCQWRIFLNFIFGSFEQLCEHFCTVFRWSKSIFLKQRQLLNLMTYVLQLYQNNADWRSNRYLLSSSGLPAWVYSLGTCPRTRYPNIIQYILSYWDPHQAWLLHQKIIVQKFLMQ